MADSLEAGAALVEEPREPRPLKADTAVAGPATVKAAEVDAVEVASEDEAIVVGAVVVAEVHQAKLMVMARQLPPVVILRKITIRSCPRVSQYQKCMHFRFNDIPVFERFNFLCIILVSFSLGGRW